MLFKLSELKAFTESSQKARDDQAKDLKNRIRELE
jgi:hypothetical protein